MNEDPVKRFVRTHGVVLVSAKGPVPNVAEFVAGAPIRGSWWGHPKGGEIFRALSRLSESSDVLVCRLVGGKLTMVHRRLWPALVRAASRLPRAALARVDQQHTDAGHHVNRITAFPEWVPRLIAAKARRLDEDEALSALGEWARNAGGRRSRAR
jgi:hypothetical protein